MAETQHVQGQGLPPQQGESALLATEIVATTAVPILKVMRLQAPELCQPDTRSLGTHPTPKPTLMLPDSFGVIHIGETFTAYLGALNPSSFAPIEGLTVMAQLQTPSRRFTLSSQLEESNAQGGVVVLPGQGVDAIVSRSLEEVGQHILRVEVGYARGTKTLRKFYRFHVASPLNIQELTLRSGDTCCFVSIAIENVTASTALTISAAEFVSPEGLEATLLDAPSLRQNADKSMSKSAADLFDSSWQLIPGGLLRFLFKAEAKSHQAKARGIGTGDVLGKAIFTWHKAMGEAGRIASTDVICPPTNVPTSSDLTSNVSYDRDFVVHGSGLSVDVAAIAAQKNAGFTQVSTEDNSRILDEGFPVTAEFIDPPCRLEIGKPQALDLRVTNHTDMPLTLQLQLRLSQQVGLMVCGTSFKNLEPTGPNGGSTVVTVKVLALMAGYFLFKGCFLVDIESGREFPMPPLFNALVE